MLDMVHARNAVAIKLGRVFSDSQKVGGLAGREIDGKRM